MSMNYDLVRDYFKRLGFEPEIADIYLALCTYGPQTISELARHSGVERTRIYRLTQDLEASNLVEVSLQYKRRIFRAAPINNLQIVLSKKEQELGQLKSDLDKVDDILNQTQMSSPTTQVQFYQGIEGIKQMLWNQTKSSTEVLSILNDIFQYKTGKAFFGRWVEAMNDRNVTHRLIVDDNFINSVKKWTAEAGVERTKLRNTRHVTPEFFTIKHATFIYDDVMAYYDWKDGQIFGVEMHNADIAATQRQFFEILWQKAQPIDG